MARLNLLQKIVLVAWLGGLIFSLVLVGRAVLLPVIGRQVTATVVQVQPWRPPVITWTRYRCVFWAENRIYSADLAVTQCRVGETATIIIDPFDSSKAWYGGEWIRGGTSLAACYLLLSVVIGLIGLRFRLAGHATPWRAAANSVLAWLTRPPK